MQNQITGANTNIQTIDANLGSFESYANTKIGTNSNSNLVVVASQTSTSTTTGALVIPNGGAGIAGNVNIGGNIVATTAATSAKFANVITTNGVFWANNVSALGNYTAASSAPVSPKIGDQWYDTTVDILYEYSTDGTSNFWLDVNSPFLYTSTAISTGTITASSTITASGNIVAAAGTASTNTTSGALVVIGGAGISGNITVGTSGGNSIVASGSITGTANLAQNLGSPSIYWGSIYAGQHTGNTFTVGGGGITTSGSITPTANVTQNLGSSTAYWGTTYSGQITANGATIGGSGLTVTGTTNLQGNVQISGPGEFITNNLIVSGNLYVYGNTTTIDAFTVRTQDLQFVAAFNAATSAATNNAGLITPYSSWVFNNATTSWQSNISVTPSGNLTLNLGGPSNYWGTTYTGGVNANTITVGGGGVTTSSAIVPNANVTYNLGSSTAYWGTTYTGGLSANTATFGGGNVTVGYTSVTTTGSPGSNFAVAGNVGIGTNAPLAALHIKNVPDNNYGSIYLGSSYYAQINQGANNLDFIINGDQAYRVGLGTNNGTGVMRFFTAGYAVGNTERMRIAYDGNVAIGTSTSTAANLTVQGTGTGTGQAVDGAPIALFNDGQPRGVVSIRGGVDSTALGTNGVLNVGGGANRTYSLTTTHGVLLASTGTTGVNVVVAGTTTSTSTTTGALVVKGGIGVNGNVYLPNNTGIVSSAAFVTNTYNIDPGGVNIAASFGQGSVSSGTGIIAWNRSAGSGEMSFIQNKGGGGVGGFYFYDWANTAVNSTTRIFDINGTGAVTAYGSISPNANVTYNLGSSTGYWGTVFAGQYTGNSAVFGGGNVTIGYTAVTTTSSPGSNFAVSGNVGIGNNAPIYKLDVGPVSSAQSAVVGASGLIRNAAGADTSPFTQARIIVYGGAGIDTTNWGYLAYGSDASMRVVYAKTGAGSPLLFGTTSATDGSGTFTEQMRLSTAGNLLVGYTAAPTTTSAASNFSVAGVVGIGTNSPGSKLDVYNSTQSSDDIGTVRSYVNDASSSSVIVRNSQGWGQLMQWTTAGMRIGNRNVAGGSAGSVYFTYGSDTVGMVLAGANGNLVITSTTTSTVAAPLSTPTTGALVVKGGASIVGNLQVGGNLVIGTPPAVASNNYASGLTVHSLNQGSSSNYFDPGNYAAHVFNQNNQPQRYGLLVSDYWRSSENYLFSVDGRYYGDGTVAGDTHTPYFIVRGDGSVGVGTNSPVAQSKLTTTGSISFTGTDTNFSLGSARGFIDYNNGPSNMRLGYADGGSATAGSVSLYSSPGSTGAVERMQIASNSMVIVTSTTGSSSNVTGAMVIKGGVGINGGINSDGQVNHNNNYSTADPASYDARQFMVMTNWTNIPGVSYSGTDPRVFAMGLGPSNRFFMRTATGTMELNAANVFVSGGGMAVAGSITPTANVTYNLGSTTAWWSTVYGKSVQAQYADLAEMYTADAEYGSGNVVVFGGTAEVTTTTITHDTRVAGVVSTKPAYLMNAMSEGTAVAMTGRVPCLVRGPVTKGMLLVTSETPGIAEAIDYDKYKPGCVLGKSLGEIADDSIQTIEVVVGRF